MKKKKKIKVRSLIIIILFILCLALISWYLFFRKEVVVSRIIDKIDKYEYTLKNTDTKSYKESYNELKELLVDETILDEEKYVELLSKLFITDFYTLNNKVTNQDIGGVQFIHTSLKQDFINKASSSVYKYIKNNIDGKRKQDLPEVISVEVVKIEKKAYKNKKDEYNDSNAYKVKVKINYKNDLGYAKEENLTFIHENNKLSIVEIENGNEKK